MSRRITVFVLAASAALIATPASADPECFGDPCHLPELVEPPATAVQPLDGDDAAATEASAAGQLPPAQALPQVLTPQVVTPQAAATPQILTPQVLTPQVATPQVVASPPVVGPRVVASPQVEVAPYDPPQPLARRPLPSPRLADETNTPREPARLAPRHLKDAPPPLRETELPPAAHPRSVHVTSPDPSYVVGYNTPPVGGVVVVVPGTSYATGRHPVYMFAPSAKIISIDSGD
jgi:hypothetical protein